MSPDSSLAQKTLDRIHQLAAITDEPGSIRRTFLSPAMAQANALVGGWMIELGGLVSEDGWGNLVGHFPGNSVDAPILLLGSHLDTVPNAGRFDGPLGVLVALASMEALASQGIRLPFQINIIGFSDEEGTRFHSAFLGSKALTGLVTESDLDLRDSDGFTVREAVAAYQGVPQIDLPTSRYRPQQLLGYVEVHIEQGPVLQATAHAIGVVDAIAAQTRLVYTVEGRAGHAGTTPMNLRRDALAGAAELILAIEHIGLFTTDLVATVGQIEVAPGASNVIPAAARISVDIRHPDRATVEEACTQLAAESQALASRRGLKITSTTVQTNDGISCSPELIQQLARAVEKQQGVVPHLVSGAGHDGIILHRITPVAMLFVRCKDGLSHHPDEHVDLADIEAAIGTLCGFLQNFTST